MIFFKGLQSDFVKFAKNNNHLCRNLQSVSIGFIELRFGVELIRNEIMNRF